MARRTSGGLYNRRKSALERLEAQLVSGEKKSGTEKVSLSIADVTRIQREVEVLKSKL